MPAEQQLERGIRPASSDMNEALRAELLAMAAADQAARRTVARLAEEDATFAQEIARRTDPVTVPIGLMDWDADAAPPVIQYQRDVDRRSRERLREILTHDGWPGRRLVGEDGACAAWLLALHADADRDLQRRALALLESAATEGDADPGQVAWLVDRLLLGEGRAQMYGTITVLQEGRPVPFRLADPAGVDARRRQVGLPPLQDQLEAEARGEIIAFPHPTQKLPLCLESAK